MSLNPKKTLRMERFSKQNSDYTSNFSQNKVANYLSLVWKNNQVRISKSNSVPQLAETVGLIIDRNSKEHPQNEVNQKELPQLKKHFI